MKKLLSIVLAGTMLLSLAACGGKEPSGNQSSSGSGGGSVNFPAGKQISLIVPYSAGGASDTTARIYATELEKALNGTVVVSNVTGASGAIGLEQVRNSNADGYTIAYMPVESTMLRALGFTDLSTDDFKFIGRAMTIPAAVTVRADAPWNTLQEFIDYAKEHPGEVQVGNSGTGSIWHVAAASIEDKCGVQFTHVPFDGAAPAVAALLGNNIQAVTVSPSEVKTNVDSGDFKVLGIEHAYLNGADMDAKAAEELAYYSELIPNLGIA